MAGKEEDYALTDRSSGPIREPGRILPAWTWLSGHSVSKRVRGNEVDDDPDRWARVKHVFQSALDRPVTERLTFVRDRCGADDDLHAEVVSLLAAHVNADGFAEVPAIQKLNPPTSLASTDHSLKRGDRLGTVSNRRVAGRRRNG